MNEKQKRNYRARMAVAQLFRSFLDQGGERARLLERLGVETLPVIIPALGSTLASHIREAATRHFEAGEEHVIVPVCLPGRSPNALKLSVLVVSTRAAKTFWQLDMNDLHDSVEMAQVVEALDASKKWDVEELDSRQQQELKDLAASA
ncbi:hypothetical protein CPHO_00505 [Corynebacterium phocae]|uniref:Uncharacterized protein n=1 Tax=Corynebacterium phocae TaxID=161895 RepID=A0A1L7D0Q5_9CORY|nr:hypothetical protein [Corynebacterium phocae]APT91658.1 hypothetical protein CPHO_00505 [Corynebacterium phocae]KAA8728631.1 hypothetical protein F4V58_00060 [Corynebacterium phocae]